MADSKIVSLASRLVEPNNDGKPNRFSNEDDDEDDDERLFAELEAEIENTDDYRMREQGLAILKQEMETLKGMQDNEYGRYTEVSDEKEVIRITAHEPRCVVHFYHPNFKRCEIMDQHLKVLAPKYFNTRFLRVFVENIPWLVEKLVLKVLPCVVVFIKGVTKDRLVGFEELGNEDEFATATLELRLSSSGVLRKQQATALNQVYSVSGGRRAQDDDDDEFDL
ncbi:thioredoxin-like protein [Cylindrobasidium torrendii FP15055 ss-10]|uniref:Thioredoxin-like protein n=1 Tax=Cylindrobasidium torrendii FP15055 ss-10 TaxID=1314674 RepID=A0A0D7BVH3_9AGAR|nr:thioredoxin-like protein [Cylindrobasidium torrendii FP15055 ss-10]